LEGLGVRLAEREDADIFPRTREFSFERRVLPFDPGKIEPLASGRDLRAVTVSAVYRVLDPDALAERWLTAYRALLRGGAKLHIGKGHTIEAYSPADEFVHFDLYESQGERVPGWRVANNDTIQLIDPTRDLGAPEQAEVALCNALNDLFSLGAVEEIVVYPFTAAPTAALAERISRNMQAFCERHGFAYAPQEPISDGTLLLGATVFGASSRQLPTSYQELREGDLILVHRPFGDLAPINVLIESRVMGDGYLDDAGFALEDVRQAVDERVAVMRRPNLDVGRVIRQYCPQPDEPFDEARHIKATGDLSGPGIDVFRELAELAKWDVVIERIPLAHEALVRWASRNFLLPNGTAGTNGAIAVVASPTVIEHVAAELEKLGHKPEIIGRIGGLGRTLTVPRETKQYIADWPSAYRVQE
jgi:selenophosphate synthase